MYFKLNKVDMMEDSYFSNLLSHVSFNHIGTHSIFNLICYATTNTDMIGGSHTPDPFKHVLKRLARKTGRCRFKSFSETKWKKSYRPGILYNYNITKNWLIY